MKHTTSSNWITVAGLLLALPAAWFITICLLKFEWGVDGPYDSAEPLLVSMGLKENLGFNINLLIFVGPITGSLLALLQVLKIQWEVTKEAFCFHFTIRRRWFPILVSAFCVSLLGILALYLLVENYN